MPRIKTLLSGDDIQKAIKKYQIREIPLVIKFYAAWCPPCKAIAPWYDTLVESYSDDVIKFASMDVDKDDEAAMKHEITSIPAFHVWHRGSLVARFGKDTHGLEKCIQECVLNTHAQSRTHKIVREIEQADEKVAFADISLNVPNTYIVKPERSPANEIQQDLNDVASVHGKMPRLTPMDESCEKSAKKQKMGENRDFGT
jgi:thioredoxin 1